ncbi:MAG: alcohol dehydrogenase catalytic domain-containing protein [Thermomicrobiales bacterium]
MVVQPGTGVEQFAAGDRVTINPLITDGNCVMCRDGQEQLCLRRVRRGPRAGVLSPA